MTNSPYHGLRPFNRDETNIFFGREQHTDELIERLGKQHFLAVVGHSGCGKSSLVRAGLIPNLQAGFLAGAGTHWRVAELRPGNQPFKNLAHALAKNGALGDTYRTALLKNQILQRGSLSLHELLAIQPLTKKAKLLIVCDQFEEIFRYHEQGSKVEAELFVKLLLASCLPYSLPNGTETQDIYVLLTMRSDFLGDCALFSGLTEKINNSLYLTPRLNHDQLREAIEEPAYVFGGEVMPELVLKLLEDATHSSDQLPLLQHALMKMWRLAEKRQNHDEPIHLTLSLYEEIGTLKYVLSNHADAIFQHKLSAEQQLLAEILFKALCERGSDQRDTRRPQKLSALVELMQVDINEIIRVIDVFRHPWRSFLTPPADVKLHADSVIDISHESLIRQWKVLKNWVAEEAASAEKYQRLLGNALRHQEGESALLQSPELEIMQKWLKEFKPTEIWAARYVADHSQEETVTIQDEFKLSIDYLWRSGKKARLKKGFSIMSFVLMSALAGLTSWQWYMAEKQKAEAVEAKDMAQLSEQQAEKHRLRAEQAVSKLSIQKQQAIAAKNMAQLAEQQAEKQRSRAESAVSRLFAQKQQAIEAKNSAELAKQHAVKSEATAKKEKQETEKAIQKLSEFALTTLDSLAKQDLVIVDQYIDDIFKAELRDVLLTLLHPLIDKTESMDDDERQYWRDLLPSMTDKQVKRLVGILFEEKTKLTALEKKYQNDMRTLNDKHFKEWIEYSIKKIDKKNPDTYLSAVHSILAGEKQKGINVDDALKYLKEYQQLSVTPTAKMYYLYGKYYQIKANKELALLNYNKAVGSGVKTPNLTEIYKYARKNKEWELTLKVAIKMNDEAKAQYEQAKLKLPKYKIGFSWINKDKEFSNEFGEFLKNIKLEAAYLKDEFLKTISRQYKQSLTKTEQDKVLKTFKVEYKPEMLHESKEAYVEAMTKLLWSKYALKETTTLPNDFEQVLQIADELKDNELVVYLNLQNALFDFYAASNNIQKKIQIGTKSLAFYEMSEQKNKMKNSWISRWYGNLSWYQLLAKHPEQVIVSAEKGLYYDKKQSWIKTNLAHGYLFSNQYCKAEEIYLEMKDEKIDSKLENWKDVILNDFKAFTEKNIIHPDMEKIKSIFKTDSPSKKCIEDKKNYIPEWLKKKVILE